MHGEELAVILQLNSLCNLKWKEKTHTSCMLDLIMQNEAPMLRKV